MVASKWRPQRFVKNIFLFTLTMMVLQYAPMRWFTHASLENVNVYFSLSLRIHMDFYLIQSYMLKYKLQTTLAVREIENIYQLQMMLILALATPSIIFGAYMVTQVPSEAPRLIFPLSIYMMVLFLYVHIGQELQTANEELPNIIFGSNWHLIHNNDFHKAVILLIERTQRREVVKLVGFVYADYPMYLKIMKLFFSFYTFLTTVAETT